MAIVRIIFAFCLCYFYCPHKVIFNLYFNIQDFFIFFVFQKQICFSYFNKEFSLQKV